MSTETKGNDAERVESEHTPTPWRVGEREAGDLVILAGERRIARMAFDLYVSTFAADANAALIVRAVNAHEALLSALRNLIDGIYSHQRAHKCPGFDCATCTPGGHIAEAEAALALATTEGR